MEDIIIKLYLIIFNGNLLRRGESRLLKNWLNIFKRNADSEDEMQLEKISTIDTVEEEKITEGVYKKSLELITQKIIESEDEDGDKICTGDGEVAVALSLEEVDIANQEEAVALAKEEVEVRVQEGAEVLTQEDADFIKMAKIQRGKSIKAKNIYTSEEKIFISHKECAKKLKIPLGYIKENLMYGDTEYFGASIDYIGNQLGMFDYSGNESKYIYNRKSPYEVHRELSDRIFSPKISERRREEILSNGDIEPVRMSYSFECLDYEYDDYYEKYKEIIKRTGKKKVELVKKNAEVIQVFKSVEQCAEFLDIDRNKIQDMLKYGETKIDRNYIQYSFRKL